MEVIEKEKSGTKTPVIKIESLFYRFPLLSYFDNFEAKKIAAYTEKKTIRRNETISKSNSRAYLVLRGKIGSFYSHPTGSKDFLVREHLIGDCVDLQSILDMEPSTALIRAIESSEVLSIDKIQLNRAIFDNKQVLNTALILQSKMLRDADLVAARVGLLDVRDRMKHFIAAHAIKEGDDFIYWANLSNRELGQRLGASREMISRLFKEFIDEGDLISDGTLRFVMRKGFSVPALS